MKVCKIIVSAVILSFVFTACAGGALRKTDLYRSYFDEPLRSGPGEFVYDKQGDTHVLHLSGDEYHMGLQYGAKAAELGMARIYAEIFENAASMLKDDAPEEYRNFINVELVKSLLLEAWEIMEPHTPAYILRMLEGFSDGSRIPLTDVYAIHALPDFTETSCSALWATGAATADGSPVQIRVLDYIMGLGIQKYPAVVYMSFPTGHTVANVGWLGLLGLISGMNEGGLAVSEMGYGDPEGENFHGIPMPFLLLDILRWCETPEEAAGIMKSNPRTNSYVYIVGSARHGGLAFITNAYSVDIITPGQEDAIVPQLPDMLQAGHYEDRMDALTAEHYGTISAEWLMEEFIPAIAMKSNLQCVVYDLDGRRFFVANAPDTTNRACDQPYREFRFPVQPAR